MTIRKGQEWGQVEPRPPDLVVASNDGELHQIVNAHRSASSPSMRSTPLAVGLTGGDLARTVAASNDPRQLSAAATLLRLTVDLGRAEFGGRCVWFASHAVLRRPGWRAWGGPLTALMNAQFIGNWDVAPRSHPNDGRLDVIATIGPFGPRQRRQARQRLRTGTHLPHPALGESLVRVWDADLGRGVRLILDGIDYGRPDHVRIAVEPDALTIYI